MFISRVKIMAICLAVIAVVGIELGVLGDHALNNSDAAEPNDVIVKKIAGKNTDGDKDVTQARLKKQTTEKNGFSVSLAAEKQTFIEGEDLLFTGRIKNVTDKDFRFYPHPSWYLDWEMTIEDNDGPWRVVALLKGKRKPPVLELKAGQIKGVGMRIDDDHFVYRWIGPKTKPMPPRDHLKPGKYKLRAVMKFIKKDTPGAPFWTGTIKTPPVAFEIVTDPIPARLKKVEWGKESIGAVAKFRAVKTVVKPGNPIEFELLVKNVSKQEFRLLGANGLISPKAWRFKFGDWEWSSPLESSVMRLKPGETASVRCLVATTRDSLTAEQKKRRFFAGPFRNVKTGEMSTRLPVGVYRVRAATGVRAAFSRGILETKVIEVRISNGRDVQEKKSP